MTHYIYKKLGLLLWLTSVLHYRRAYYKVDKLMFNWVLFSAGSLVASMGIASFFFESAYSSAAKMNNRKEIEHLTQIGRI